MITIRLLDLGHIVSIIASLYHYMIVEYGNENALLVLVT